MGFPHSIKSWCLSLCERFIGFRPSRRPLEVQKSIECSTVEKFTEEPLASAFVEEADSDSCDAAVLETHKRKSLIKIRNKIADTASDILERFEKLSRGSLEVGSHTRDSAASLELLLGCDFHLLEDGLHSEDLGHYERAVFSPVGRSAELADITWPIDIGMIVRKENSYFVQRVFTAKPEEIRGKIRRFSTKSVFLVIASLKDDGTWWSETRIAGLINNKWAPIDDIEVMSKGGTVRTFVGGKGALDQVNDTTGIAFSMALTERYDWHAALGSTEGPRLLLPTSSAGASALFKDREKAYGKGRRGALRHWVQNHYRSKEEDLVYVRDHLRGTTQFNWAGMSCELLVSQFDLEKNEFFKSQASEWRSARKHNRVKVRLKRAV